VSAWIEITP